MPLNNSFGMLGPVILLGVLLLAGWVVNRLAGKPVLNAAKVFLWVAAGAMVWSALRLLDANGVDLATGGSAYVMGRIVGTWILPMLLAAHLARRFKAPAATEAVAGKVVER